MASVHETAEALAAAGVISKQKLQEFNQLCLMPIRSLEPEKICDPRIQDGVS
jgi:DNA-binding transcriptional regulator YiaG